MNKRVELHYILQDILGSSNVYFQPPASIKIKYPAIIYSLSTINTRRADDKLYTKNKRYVVTIIDEDPDTDFVDKLLELPYCSFSNHYRMDNLNHYIFNLYY